MTAIMTRIAPEILWLSLEKKGVSERFGVTDGHPLYAEGRGWVTAAELAPGDRVRVGNLDTLMVLAVDIELSSHRVHNLEIAGAATYLVGEAGVLAALC